MNKLLEDKENVYEAHMPAPLAVFALALYLLHGLKEAC